MSLASIWNNLFKHWISSEFLLMEGYVQGALGKELHMVPLVERFKKLLWETLLINFTRDERLFTGRSTKGAAY